MPNIAKLGIVEEGSDEPNDIADKGFDMVKITSQTRGEEWSKTTKGYTKDIGMNGEIEQVKDDDPNDFTGTVPTQPDTQGTPSDFLGAKGANPKQKINGFDL